MDLQQNILNWLKSLKGWQTELAYRLLAKSNLEDADIDDIISMLKNGGSFEDKAFPNLGMSFVRQPVTLLSIDSIENIEQLSPRNPLKFAERGITVVYGNNGTGKSGYARILKNYAVNLMDEISSVTFITQMIVRENAVYPLKTRSKSSR